MEEISCEEECRKGWVHGAHVWGGTMAPLSRQEVPDTPGIWVKGMNSYLGELFSLHN